MTLRYGKQGGQANIFLATPAYDGRVHVQYAISLADTNLLLQSNGVPVQVRINTTGSLLVAERNRLTQAFWESDCTHMLCIDSDLGWPADAVKALIDHDEEFVAGVYPSRKEESFLFRPFANEDNSLIVSPKKLIKMQYIPAGFMLIKRSAIEKMRNHFPELYFEPKHPESNASKGYCFFDTEVFEGEFWGEDYVFCRRARQAGVDIWVDPMIEFDHAGMRGMLANVLTNNREQAEKRISNEL